MARPTKPPASSLLKTARFRVTETELAETLPELAKAAGYTTVSDYCRAQTLNAKPRRKKATPERLALIAGLGQLGHIRSDINKLLQDRWAYKYVTPEQVAKALAKIEALADTIQTALSDGH